jgi:ribosomal protein S18 acetylase RimI-like enzyme
MTASLSAPVSSDYEALASWVPTAEACARWAGAQLQYPFTPEQLPALLEVPGKSFVLTREDRKPVAFGQYRTVSADTVHLCRIIVSPAWRGHGYGKQLCQQLIAQALADTGASMVTLRVYRDNAVAQSLYHKLGFKPVELRSDVEVIGMRLIVSAASL